MNLSRKDQKDDVRKDKLTDRPPAQKPSPVFGLPLGTRKQVEFTIPQDLAVVLSRRAFSQLFGYAQATELEISLLGIVEREKSLFVVREFFLVQQQGAMSHTELDSSAVGELVERLISEDRVEDAKKIRCWAHSHPQMDVFWSTTDDANCVRMTSDWLVSIVVSDGFRIRCRLDAASPVPWTLDHIPVFVESPVDAETAEKCKAELQEKLRHVPLLGLRDIASAINVKNKEGNEMPRTIDYVDHEIEIMEYCDCCGTWHSSGGCPMELESSAYQLAHDERAQEHGGIWDDLWD